MRVLLFIYKKGRMKAFAACFPALPHTFSRRGAGEKAWRTAAPMKFIGAAHPFSLQEDEVYGGDKAEEGGKMVPLQGLALEYEHGEDGEDSDGEHLLDNLQLHQGEGSAVALESDAVAVHLADVFGKGKEPRGKDDDEEGGMVGDDAHGLELEMAIPGECHEYVGEYQQYYCEKSFHAWNQKKG